MKMPLGTEIDLGPSHIVLDGDPPLREKGTAALLFLAHVCCGHVRPIQLLLSSCLNLYYNCMILMNNLTIKSLTDKDTSILNIKLSVAISISSSCRSAQNPLQRYRRSAPFSHVSNLRI